MYRYSSLIILLALLFPAASTQAVDFLDSDFDGLSDSDEVLLYHTDPAKADTDGDTYNDGEEIQNNYSPRHSEKTKLNKLDSDKDGLNDALEIALTTNLTNPDTDNDGQKDGAEAFAGFNPLGGDKDRSLPRRVEVDLNTQQLHYFLNNVKLGSMPVSSGLARTPTPTGEFKIERKRPVVNYVGVDYNLPNTKWNLEFKSRYYLHGAYWHNQFGIRPMSHGCVNIAYKDVEKLYKFLDVGDAVKIYGKAPARVKVAVK